LSGRVWFGVCDGGHWLMRNPPLRFGGAIAYSTNVRPTINVGAGFAATCFVCNPAGSTRPGKTTQPRRVNPPRQNHATPPGQPAPAKSNPSP